MNSMLWRSTAPCLHFALACPRPTISSWRYNCRAFLSFLSTVSQFRWSYFTCSCTTDPNSNWSISKSPIATTCYWGVTKSNWSVNDQKLSSSSWISTDCQITTRLRTGLAREQCTLFAWKLSAFQQDQIQFGKSATYSSKYRIQSNMTLTCTKLKNTFHDVSSGRLLR